MADHYLAFNHEFFKKHQRKLLWLLNTPVVRLWFRWILRLGTSSLGTNKVARIEPHAITWQSGWTFRRTRWATFKQPTFTSEFRTHWKFGKRLYYAFRPVWWLMHFWDWSLADRVVPQLSFGFSTLTAYPDAGTGATTVDGRLCYDTTGTTWATTHDATSAIATNSSNTTSVDTISQCERFGGSQYIVSRMAFLFDTSGLTASATISAATISFYATGAGDATSSTGNLALVSVNPAANNTLALSDYDQTKWGTTRFATDYSIATFIASAGYKDLTLNASGIGAISKTAISKFGIRGAADVDNTAPTARSYCLGYFSDQTGTTNDPKLVVTYTANTIYTRTIADSMMNGASRVSTLTRTLSSRRSMTDTIMNAASRFASPSAFRSVLLTISDSMMNAVGRLATIAHGLAHVRAMSDTLMNAAGRADSLSRIVSFVRTATDSLMNAAARLATLSRSAVSIMRTMSDSMMNSAGRFSFLKTFLNGLNSRYSAKDPRTGTTSYSETHPRRGTSYDKTYPDA